ncbi:MAG: TOMM precursor leader peptide-binding protein [Acidobacteriota bacterium]
MTTALPKKPAFRPSYCIAVAEPEGVFLLSERQHIVLQGTIYCEVAPYLDGRFTAEEIVDRLEGKVSPAEVYYALDRLQRAGHLVDGTIERTERSIFWSASGFDAEATERQLSTRTVALAAFGDLGLDALTAALADLGVRAVDRDADLQVAITDDYLSDGLEETNARAIAMGRPWLIAKPTGSTLWFGPLFQPGRTACWECLAQRLRGHREVEAFLRSTRPEEGIGAARSGHGALGADLAVNLLALEVVGALVATSSDAPNAMLDAVVTLDLLALKTVRHTLTRRPTCPACGTADRDPARAPAPPVLGSRPKRFTIDGGHRSATPNETLARFEHHISPITGVVSALAPADDVDRPFGFVYDAAVNLGGRRDNLAGLRRWLATSCSGNGMTDAQARASALCEALERYSGMFQGDEIRRTTTRKALGELGIDPNACMLFSAAQYDHHDELNAGGSRFNFFPQRLDEHTEIDWSPAWSLTEQRYKYLPTEFLYYGVPRRGGVRYCFADSNGCAAGNSPEEAILQGIVELVERDSVGIWWYNRLQRPAVDLDSFDERFLDDLRRRHHEAGRQLWALDLTTDLHVPVIAVLSRLVDASGAAPSDAPSERIMFGIGAHVDARIALLHACTELNQFAASSLRLDDQQVHPSDDPDHRRWWGTATCANQPFVRPADGPARRRRDFDDWENHDIWADVLRCQSILEARGLELLMLDQTRSDVGLPVVKVTAPGLRHHYARFAPGRLFEVPVQLGWLESPTAEEHLNPIPMFR